MRSVLIVMVLAATSTATIAQWYPDSDPRSSNYQQYLQQQREESTVGKGTRKPETKLTLKKCTVRSRPLHRAAAARALEPAVPISGQGKELLRLPPLPVERNVLLGSWRLEGGGQHSEVGNLPSLGRALPPGSARWDFCRVLNPDR